MRYAPWIDLALRHSYYEDGRCLDFAIRASQATLDQLANHRCLLRIEDDRVRILVALGETGGPLIPSAQGLTLRFELTLHNTDFLSFTDLSEISAQAAPLFIAPASDAADPQRLQLAATADPAHSPALFAAIELHPVLAASSTAPVPISYTLSFQAKQARWAYYCLTSTSTDVTALHIVDASPSGTADVLLFSDSNRTNLSDAPDQSDRTGLQLQQQYPSLRCVRFLSDQLIPCRKQPRKYLELRLGEERLIGPLPNPSPRSAVGGSLLFRVIKYRTQPLLTQ